MAIALSDELQEHEGLGANRALRAVCGRSLAGLWQVRGRSVAGLCQLGDLPVAFLQNIARADVPWSAV